MIFRNKLILINLYFRHNNSLNSRILSIITISRIKLEHNISLFIFVDSLFIYKDEREREITCWIPSCDDDQFNKSPKTSKNIHRNDSSPHAIGSREGRHLVDDSHVLQVYQWNSWCIQIACPRSIVFRQKQTDARMSMSGWMCLSDFLAFFFFWKFFSTIVLRKFIDKNLHQNCDEFPAKYQWIMWAIPFCFCF